MIPFDEARHRVLEDVRPLGIETLPLDELDRRVLAHDVHAPFDLPEFDRSAVDGYGVSGESLEYQVIGEIAAGDDPAPFRLTTGQAVRLFTGSAVPPGVTAIVMQEDVRKGAAIVSLDKPPDPGQFIRRRGAELIAGALVLPSGTPVNPAVISLLATLGNRDAHVYRRPTVAILATGSELAAPGTVRRPGQVYEAVTSGLRAAVLRAGGDVVSIQRVEDAPDATRAALERALACDVILTCGGVSVGDHDLVRPTLAALGVEERIWGVAMRPGKPFYFGMSPNGHRVFGLPGNPVSAFATFALLVAPVLAKLQGQGVRPPEEARGHLDARIPKIGNRDDFLRARKIEGWIYLEEAQESHMLTGLANANGFARLRAGSGPYVHGDILEFIRIGWE